jgi:hypothetical protein
MLEKEYNDMRKFVYDEYGKDEPVVKTEEEIMAEGWEDWVEKMERKYYPGHEYITKECFLEDWCITHGAWEYD